MPLFINADLVDETQKFDLKQYPILAEKSQDFIKCNIESKKLLKKDDRVLYVSQREFATISTSYNACNFKWIATNDATTCHIVVIIERESKSISVGHFDGFQTDHGLDSMFQSLLDITTTNKFEAFVFSGFLDEKKYSKKLSAEIMDYFIQSKYEISFELLCACALNNQLVNGLNTPLITGVGVNINTLEFVVVSKCTERGPDYILRQACTMGAPMKNIYNVKNGFVYIEPYNYKVSRYAKQLLELDDERYLSIMSTSPHCEPDDFVVNSKTTLKFMLEYPNPVKDVFNGKIKKYKMLENHEWVEI